MSGPPSDAAAGTGPVVPRATYRLQLHRGFRFVDALAIVPYLDRLGVSHVYCSPVLRSRPGSAHGYDVVDHGELDPELGTAAEFDALVDALRARGMGVVLDVVPNHMAVLGVDNAWWLDVLEHGRASPWAQWFDIDWAASDPALHGRVLLPILGDHYGVALERGELRPRFDAPAGRFAIRVGEHDLPVDPSCYGGLLRRALRGVPASGAGGDAAALLRLADAFERLPSRDVGEPPALRRRCAETPGLKASLAELCARRPALATVLHQATDALAGRVGEPASFDALDALIGAQAYRLAHWRVASDEINYRRFFDINELAALRMEREDVFDATHALVLELAARGRVDGLRIDHPDGLSDPAGYFRRLQARFAERRGLPAPGDGGPDAPLYVVIEKISAPHERIPADWAVHGTTGYEYANLVNGLMVDEHARHRLDRVWRAFAGDEAEDFDTLAWRGRHAVMDGSLAAELGVLSAALLRLARADRRTRDFTLGSLRKALAEVAASFPVYRTYVVERAGEQDRRHIDWAIGRARRRSRVADPSVFDFVRRVLLGRPRPGVPAALAAEGRAFVRRLQQYTAPVAAKGIEDTALYRHQRLVSLNDVGGDPDVFGVSVRAFHAANRERVRTGPHGLLATSTHDAKRSEDVRLRIDAIAELPAAWRLLVRRWSRMNRSHRRIVDGERAPSRNDEYLLYQTLVGSLPPGPLDGEALEAYASRVEAAMLKSAREAKLRTAWLAPNAPYEAALCGFVRAALARRDSNLFLGDLVDNAAVFAWWGALAGLTQVVLKTFSPGVPDFYQGCETIEPSLVDPDNRRPVDFARRRAMLEEACAIAALPDRAQALHELLVHATDGRAKLWATWRALDARRRNEAMLREAEYLGLEADGPRARHVVAFARRAGSRLVVVVGTRLHASLGLPSGQPPVGRPWAATTVALPAAGADGATVLVDAIAGRTHAASDGRLALGEVLADFPVAVLEGESPA